MQLTAHDMRRLIKAGVKTGALLIIAEILEGVQAPSASVSAPVSAATKDDRRAKDRERKRLARLAARKLSADGADMSATLSAKSPTPPLIESPPIVVSKGVLKEGKSPEYAREELDSFERFKAAYPKRSGNQPWIKALPKYVRIVRGGVRDLVLIESADKYRKHCDAEGKTKTGFVQQAITWLNQEGWKNDYELNGSRGSALSQASAIVRDRLSGGGFDFGLDGDGGAGDKASSY